MTKSLKIALKASSADTQTLANASISISETVTNNVPINSVIYTAASTIRPVAAGVTAVAVSMYGGGGGGGGWAYGNGGKGGDSVKIDGIITLPPNTVSLRIKVGYGGFGGETNKNVNAKGGAGGLGYQRGGNGSDAGASRPGSGSGGGGGGGGGSTAIEAISSSGSSTLLMVAGGGGGGAGAVYNLEAAAGGYPANSYNTWIEMKNPANYPTSTSTFITTYGIELSQGSGDANERVFGGFSVVINFPTTGNYVFSMCSETVGHLFFDGIQKTTAAAGPRDVNKQIVTVNVSTAGNHNVSAMTRNSDNANSGIAVRIVKPDGSELWNTRNLINRPTTVTTLLPELLSTNFSAPDAVSWDMWPVSGDYESGGGGGGGGSGGIGGIPGNWSNIRWTATSGSAGVAFYNTSYVLVQPTVTVYPTGGSAGVIPWNSVSSGTISASDLADASNGRPGMCMVADSPSTQYVTVRYTTSTQVKVPANTTSMLIAIAGGGGGGGGLDSWAGGGGGSSYEVMANVTIPSNTASLRITIGQGGQAGKTGGNVLGGTGGSGYQTGGQGGNSRPSGSSGSGGGGGGSSTIEALLTNGTYVMLAHSGGGGGGGGGSNNTHGISGGNPNLLDSQWQASSFTFTTGSLRSDTYEFLNSYGVVKSGGHTRYGSVSTTLYFPETANYTFSLAGDDHATMYIDTTEVYNRISNLSSKTLSVTKGVHTIRLSIDNDGGASTPYALAALIENASGSFSWSTLNLTDVDSALLSNTFTENAYPGASPNATFIGVSGDGGGAGGGGGGGGLGGSFGYDETTYEATGGTGGLNYVNSTYIVSGSVSKLNPGASGGSSEGTSLKPENGQSGWCTLTYIPIDMCAVAPVPVGSVEFKDVGTYPYNIPAGVRTLYITAVGGGGGGGGAYDKANWQGGSGGGGGAGGVVQAVYTIPAGTPAVALSVTIASGGTGGAYTVDAGNDAYATQVSVNGTVIVKASGGFGGKTGGRTVSVLATGGIGGTGQIIEGTGTTETGNNGENGALDTANSTSTLGGVGGKNSTIYGRGGAGAASTDNGIGHTGLNGTDGYVKITW